MLFPWLGSPPSCCLLCALAIILGHVQWGCLRWGRSVFCPELHGWIVETTGLQVVEQLMGRSQGPAVTKGNLFFSHFLIVVALARRRHLRPRGRQPRGCRIHAHSPSHSHTRPHTHSSDRDAGREGNLMAGGRWGLARVRGFSSYWAIWRLREMKGRVDREHSQSSTLGDRNGFHPGNFNSPLTPVSSLGRN